MPISREKPLDKPLAREVLFVNENNNDSAFSKKLMAKESELLDLNHSYLRNYPNDSKDKNYKDSPFNHCKITRQNENMLKDLMIDFNIGLIIQMNLQ
jgi:hypothetical protein